MISQADKQQIMQMMFNSPVAALRKLVQGDLYEFLQYFWPEYSSEDFIPNWHIEIICQELEKIARNVAAGKPKEYDLLINVPPGTTKTASVSVMFPVWCWVNWHYIRFITASYTSDVALEAAEYARDVVKSDRFKRLFPEIEIKPDKDTKHNYKINKVEPRKQGKAKRIPGGNRFSTSVTGTLTGFHGHIQIIDDPLDPRRAGIESLVDAANRWIGQTLSTRKVDKRVTPLIMIQQRLHQNDPTGYMLDTRKAEVKHICLPGEIKNYRSEVSPKHLVDYYKDDLLDPKRLDWVSLKDLETQLGQYGYAGQIGQKPVPPGGGMFKVDNFEYIDELPYSGNIMRSVRYWDKAGTEGGGAYTAGVLMHQVKGGKWIVADVVRGQWASDMREKMIRWTAERDGTGVEIYIEQEPGSSGKDSVQSTIRNLAGFSAHADRPTGNKINRADSYSVQVNNGNIQILKGDWNKEFIGEHRYFPYSKYKDQCDASSGSFNQLLQEKEVVVWN